MDTEQTPLLRIDKLNSFYGESHVLHDVKLEVRSGEVISLLGRNGAGRSTLLKSILGLVPRRTGRIELSGRETTTLAPFQIARLGIGYCPEDRGIFSSLNVEENLLLPPVLGPGGMGLEEIFTMFPQLKTRLKSVGTRLSGGEQQMLALARILRTGARLLLLDEITEGLAPVIVQELGRAVRQLITRGYTIVLVEQNFRFSADLADRLYVLENGRIVENISRADLGLNLEKINRYLSV